jgi:hypothetical protein
MTLNGYSLSFIASSTIARRRLRSLSLGAEGERVPMVVVTDEEVASLIREDRERRG